MSTATYPVFYWHDGYFVEDQEEAELMDSINAFGSQHGIYHVPSTWSHEQIQHAINERLTKQEANADE